MTRICRIRSYTIDFQCTETQALFTPEEWAEISRKDSFELPPLPTPVENYMSSVRQAMLAGRPVCSVPLPEVESFACHLIQMSCITWEYLYKKEPSPFVIKDLTEAFWARKSWPLLMELLEDLNNIYMIDGEKCGVESARRRNQGRSWNPEEDTPRKRMGRKLDLIARDVMEKKDWAIIERMKEWDPQSTKFLKESGFDLIREELTILHNRVHEAHNDSFQEQARFFGIYTGGKNI
ncbi:hypothetical protein BGX34_005282 [Mortierella sp. NVP85]|nr:hypothetical protein BGX34_005282 [Mortierella sp. NVP85]